MPKSILHPVFRFARATCNDVEPALKRKSEIALIVTFIWPKHHAYAAFSQIIDPSDLNKAQPLARHVIVVFNYEFAAPPLHQKNPTRHPKHAIRPVKICSPFYGNTIKMK